MKWAHLALVSLAEPHDEAPCDEIHGLGSNENRITNHRRMNQNSNAAVHQRENVEMLTPAVQRSFIR